MNESSINKAPTDESATDESVTDESVTGESATNESIINNAPPTADSSPDSQNNRPYYVVRIWHHPFVAFIWIGACFMAAGGVASLLSRIGRKQLESPSFSNPIP